jgi:DNA polymerase-3 subunit epsilon
MRASIDTCGCFPTGRHYPGIADRLARTSHRVAGMAHGFPADLDWPRAPFVVIDFETTGLDPEKDRIVEVGVALFRGSQHEKSENWLVQPGMPINPEASAVHGITDENVKDAPVFGEVWSLVRPLLEGRLPVAYNHRFDSRFLWAELRRLGMPTTGTEIPPAASDDGVWIDPFVWVREIYKNEKGFSLTDTCARLGVPLETAHRASHDAEAAGKVLLAIAAELPQRYGELLRIQQRYAATQDVEITFRRR